ncbi:MAG UNVERIFIED_CONTAM: hypothetical protein LVR18_43220 [Planctomycetaceae bacterium]
MLLSAEDIEFFGTLKTSGATAAVNDTEIQFLATNRLQLPGSFDVAGSVLLASPQSPQLAGFSGRQTGATSIWTIQTAALDFGQTQTDAQGRSTVNPVAHCGGQGTLRSQQRKYHASGGFAPVRQRGRWAAAAPRGCGQPRRFTVRRCWVE